MCFTKYNGKLASAICLADYQTADIFDSAVGVEGIPDNFMSCMSPKFISEAVEVFDGSDVTIKMNQRTSQDGSWYTSGMWFENEDFKCMVLPVSGSPEIAENMRKIIGKI